MEMTGIVIDTPDKFVEWCRNSDGIVKLRRRGAAIIMDYLSRHGKTLSANENGELFLNSGFMTEKVTFDEVVDQVCDWNYKELVDARDRKEKPVDFLDYCRNCTLEKDLEEHKFILDRIFSRTVYGREIQMMAHRLAGEMMKEMHLIPTFDMGEMAAYDEVAKKAEEHGGNGPKTSAEPENRTENAVFDTTGIVQTEQPVGTRSSLVSLAMQEISNREQGRTR